MRHSLPIAPQFYVTAPQPCPYLQGKWERKLFTSLQGTGAEELNDALSGQGFRRSQNVLYRPACAECAACMSARIPVKDFTFTKSQKRILKRNAALGRTANAPWATEDQYALFQSYLDTRHIDGGMSDMDIFEFASMVEETPIRTRVLEYLDQDNKDALTAVCLTDVLEDGLSMVYSFFDTTEPKRSLGTYLILDHIKIAQEVGLPYVYLGFWVPGSEKMAYKSRFKGVEIYRHGAWEVLNTDADYSDDLYPSATPSINDQVGAIQMPPAK
ncbi:MAG: arginyltransferase [Planktomarina sp.]